MFLTIAHNNYNYISKDAHLLFSRIPIFKKNNMYSRCLLTALELKSVDTKPNNVLL